MARLAIGAAVLPVLIAIGFVGIPVSDWLFDRPEQALDLFAPCPDERTVRSTGRNEPINRGLV